MFAPRRGDQVGGIAGKLALKAGAGAATKTAAELSSEVITMVSVGAALEGKVPEPHEFLDGAILVAGLRGAVKVSTKARELYAKKNVSPATLAAEADAVPSTKQRLVSETDTHLNPSGKIELNPELAKPVEKPVGNVEKPIEMSAEVKEILSKVGEKAEIEKPGLDANKVYTALVDKLDPINQVTKELAGGKELLAENNPYILARETVDYKSKARHFFTKATHDFNLKNNGDGLIPILKSVESVQHLEAYMISKRAIEKSKQGITTGFNTETATKVVKELGPKYEQAAKQVTEFSNRVLDYVAESGVLSKEQLANIKDANKDYVPFKRLMSAEETAAGKKSGKGGSLKKMTGSERDIQSPVMSIAENTIELIRLAEVNRPKLALVELIKTMPEQTVLKEVPAKTQSIKVSAEEIKTHIEKEGLEGVNAEAVKDMLIFRKQAQDLTPNQFAVFENGKRKVYETTPELAEAISRLGGDATSTNILFKMANAVTTVKKIGITFTPDFIARNLFRDFLTSQPYSKYGAISPGQIVSAMGDIIKKNDVYYDWLKSGGANGAFLDLGNKYVKTDILKLQKETGFLNSARNVVEKPIELMRVAAELSEQSLRIAEFKNARKKGASLQAAGYASREITIDFQRVGAKMSALNSITAFMNVSIQGLDKSARAFKENPGKMSTMAVGAITVPSLLLYWANKDDPRYQEIPRWQKDLFWVIPTDSWQEVGPEEADGAPEYLIKNENGKTYMNKGVVYRLPKPHELGVIFGSLPERALEAFLKDNPNAMKDFEDTMLNLVTPSFVPDAVLPVVEQYFNKSLFTGRDIVPHHLKGVLPEYQYAEYTTEVGKTLGKLVGNFVEDSSLSSPMVIDNYIRSWGGSLGSYAVDLADKSLKASGVVEDNVDPASTLADTPFIKSFVIRYPSANANSVQDFFDTYEKNAKYIATIQHLAKRGEVAEAEKLMLLERNQDKLIMLEGIKDALSESSRFIRLVYRNPEATPDEKRQMIDITYYKMIEAAKNGNELMGLIKKDLGE